jgi:protein SCO1/2
MTKTILSTLALMFLLIFSYLATKKQSEFNPFTLTLTTTKGETNLHELKKNKLTLMYFGFLACPDACPTTLSTVGAVFRELKPEEMKKINFLFVDLDPERDTLARINEYINYFHKDIIGVSMPLKDLDAFTRYFGIVFMKVPLTNSKMGYTIDHSTGILSMNAEGKILPHIEHGTNKTVMLALIRQMLAEIK